MVADKKYGKKHQRKRKWAKEEGDYVQGEKRNRGFEETPSVRMERYKPITYRRRKPVLPYIVRAVPPQISGANALKEGLVAVVKKHLPMGEAVPSGELSDSEFVAEFDRFFEMWCKRFDANNRNLEAYKQKNSELQEIREHQDALIGELCGKDVMRSTGSEEACILLSPPAPLPSTPRTAQPSDALSHFNMSLGPITLRLTAGTPSLPSFMRNRSVVNWMKK